MAISRAVNSHPRSFISLSVLALSLAASACTKDDDPIKPNNNDRDGGSGGSDGTGGRNGSGGSGTGGDSDPDSGSGGSGGASPEAGPDGGPFSVTGKLSVSDQLFVDSDTADSETTPVLNDFYVNANPVSSPGFIGGYLGMVSGADGGQRPDDQDAYKVTLAANDTATLYIAANDDGSVPDFDLYLAAEADPEAAIDESIGSEPVEQVTATQAGTYFLYVSAPGGDAGRYTLSIGKAPTSNAVRRAVANKLSTEFEFVPGEAIVKFKPGVNAVTKTWATLRARPIGVSRNTIGSVHVALVGEAVTKRLSGQSVKGPYDAASTIAAIKALRKNKDILYAEPNYIRRIHAPAPNDPLYKNQWHYPQINLLDAWDHTKGADVVVAVLDTGVVLGHPDFRNSASSNQLVAGYDMISSPRIGGDGDGRDSNPDDPGDDVLVTDSSWHGTHVAGTIAAATGNGVGAAGVAPEAKVMPVRVLGVGGGTTDDIVQGILYAAGLPNDAGVLPAKKADIINMSLGGRGLSRAMADAIADARAAGTIVVVSAGNDNTDAGVYSPAGEAGVVTVGAVDYSKRRASYSNYGSVVEVVAPGGDETKDANNDGMPDGVLSLVNAKGGKTLYTTYEGTSMAAPHAAGVIALMKAVYPGLTPDILDTMIRATGTSAIVQDLGESGKDDDFGYGLLNANLAVVAALERAQGPAPTAPVLQVSTNTLDFGTTETVLDVEIRNVGRGTLTVTSATATAGFTVAPGALGANTVTLNRTGLPDGIHTGTLTIATNGGNATVNLRATIGEAAVKGGDVGMVYVLLVDPETNEGRAQVNVNAGTEYAFSLPDVAAAQYIVVAGTDIDNNGIINDEGEAFGAFPTTSNPEPLDLTSSRSDIEFPVRFQFNVAAASTGPAPNRSKFRRLR